MTTTEAVETPLALSEQIRQATWGDHGDAEKATYMDDLLAGKLNLAQYSVLKEQLWFVYNEIEEAANRFADDSAAQPFASVDWMSKLRRLPSLERDLDFMNPGWRGTIEPTPETQAYVARLREKASDWAPGWVAHHYTRYMGDLSGGQMIARLAWKLYDISPERGAEFYHFADIESPKAFREDYRDALDALPLDEEERLAMVAEVKAAYRLNTDMLANLNAYLPR
ncbi:MAG: biliverdin-producing heme oxygenase [Actinobacteria bacterium]|nr:biliverdin-producing heme oxygenase [Actinomycetota bacterium]